MEQILKREELTALGVAAYEDGLEAHAQEVSSLVQLLNVIVPNDGLVAVVGDTGAPEIVRLRALAHVTEEWSRYSKPLETQAESGVDSAFEDLLEAWRSHQDLRASGASIGELFTSRIALDEIRRRVRSLRRELGSTAGTGSERKPS